MQRRRRVPGRRKPRASTLDIVGQNTSTSPAPVKWRRHYKRLLELRERIVERQADLTSDAIQAQPTFSSHMADAATDTYDRDLALGMLSSEQDALYKIDQALDRIRNGKYGVCEMTGKPIEERRLEAIPWTRFSAAAERQIEQEGGRKNTRLGPRETVVRSNDSSDNEAG